MTTIALLSTSDTDAFGVSGRSLPCVIELDNGSLEG